MVSQGFWGIEWEMLGLCSGSEVLQAESLALRFSAAPTLSFNRVVTATAPSPIKGAIPALAEQIAVKAGVGRNLWYFLEKKKLCKKSITITYFMMPVAVACLFVCGIL